MSELVLVVESLAKIGTISGKILEDGISIGDLPSAFDLLTPLAVLSKTDFPALMESLKPENLTEEAKAEAVAAFDAAFDLKSDSVEAKIEEAVAILALAHSVAMAIAQLVSRVKKLADSVAEELPQG